MKKKIIISSIAVIFIIGVFILGYFNFIKPIKVTKMNVLCQNWAATYVGIKAFEEMYNSGDYNPNTTIIHSFDGKLPSENPDDYMTVYISFDLKNRSLFQNCSADGYISNIEINKDMALFSGTMSDVVTPPLFRLSESTCNIVLNIYVANRSDDEIKEFIRGITVSLNCTGDIIGNDKFDVKLDSVDDIVIER